MKPLLKFSLIAATILSSHAALAAEPSNDLKNKIAQIGTIKEVKETPTKGMYAWLLEKNGKTLVLYNTPDNKHFFKGDIYELSTKKLISNEYAIASLKYASPDFRSKVVGKSQLPQNVQSTTVQSPDKGYMNLSWGNKEIPEILTMIDDLKGAKEGKGKPQDTLYIFYDPNCTWCHTTYNNLRPYVKMGYTIKWLPTFARGKSESSLALNATALQNPNKLNEVFSRSKFALSSKPTEQNIKDIDKNLQFLFAYHKKVLPEMQPSVPFGLFLDKSTGKVTHLQGLSEKPIIELLYGVDR